MSNGGLIKLHSHDNKEILDKLTIVDGNLLYNNKPIYIQVSTKNKNLLIQESDGLYVDGSYMLTKEQYDILTQFNFENNTLSYAGKEVPRKYSDAVVEYMIDEIWQQIESESESGEEE